MEIEQKKNFDEPFWQIGSYTIHSLDTIYQKMMYVMLRQYIDDKKQCFPSVKTLAEECSMSVAKATEVLKELEEKKIITKTSRYLESGGQTSNIYTIHDHVKVKPKQTKPKPINDSVPEFEALTAKQKKEVSAADQADQSKKSTGDTSNDITTLRLHNNTLLGDSQAENRIEKVAVQTKYREEFLKNQYEYQVMIAEFPAKKENIDICINIISATVNSKKKNIRIQKEEIPHEEVAERLLKLTKDDILWAIKRFEQQPNQIHSPKAYLLTLLYDSKNQRLLDLQNRQAVAAAAAAAAAAPQPQTPKAVAKGTETFRNFTERQNNNYMAKILGQYSLPPEDQAADVGEESAL